MRGDPDSEPENLVFRKNAMSKKATFGTFWVSMAFLPVVFLGFFRRFRRLTRRNSELDENFG